MEQTKQNRNIELAEIVQEYYSKNPLVRWIFWQRLKKAIKLLPRENNLNILDLGCGAGIFLDKLHEISQNQKNYHLTGTDTNAKVLELDKPYSLIQSDLATKLPFKDQEFDVVFCLDVLEHCQDLNIPLKEISRILKPNGHLIVSVPTENFFYKCSRFLLKGTFSMQEGPAAGPHHHTAYQVRKLIKNYFKEIKNLKIPIPLYPFDLFHILKFQN